MNDILDIFNTIMEGHGKNKGYSPKKIMALDDDSRARIVYYLDKNALPIPACLFASLDEGNLFAEVNGYSHSCIENGILVYKV